MKKLLLLAASVALLASCSITNSAIQTATVDTPILSATMSTVDVEAKPISYDYYPSGPERRNLSVSQLVSNAQYTALKNHGSGDVLVKVSYKISAKRFGVFKWVKSISITGFPATYTNFREPTSEDRENIKAIYNQDDLDEILNQHKSSGIKKFKFHE